MGSLYIVVYNIQLISRKDSKHPFCPYQTKQTDPQLFKNYMNFVKQPNCEPTQMIVCDLKNKQKLMVR